MKLAALAFTAMVGTIAFIPGNASAAVCADGVWRAGCAGPRGAVVVRKPRRVVVAPVVAPVVVAPVAPVVVVKPRCRIVNGVRVCA